MTKNAQAAASFAKGFSCSQAVLEAFSEELGLSREQALKISQPFGGGIARMGEMCGAVTGAFLVIGLKHGRTRVEDEAAKEKTYALVHEFTNRFRALHGSIRCKDLLGCDLSTPEGPREAHDKHLIDERCPMFVRSAVEILEDLL